MIALAADAAPDPAFQVFLPFAAAVIILLLSVPLTKLAHKRAHDMLKSDKDDATLSALQQDKQINLTPNLEPANVAFYADWAVDMVAVAASLVPPAVGLLALRPNGFGLAGLLVLLIVFATTITLFVWVAIVPDVASWIDKYWLGLFSPVVLLGTAANVLGGAVAVAVTR